MKTKITITITLLAMLFFSLNAKPPIPTPENDPLSEIDRYLLKKILEPMDTSASLSTVLEDKEFKGLVKKMDLKLFSGPMLGCVTDSSAKFWMRTLGVAQVKVVVGVGKKLESPINSKLHTTSKDDDYTCVVSVGGLKANTDYFYDVVVDGKSILAGKTIPFKTVLSKGMKGKFSFAFGGGARYNAVKEKIWDVIASHKPNAFLFMGDNLYIDDPEHLNRNRVYYYRRQLRPEYRRLTQSCAIYAIWDDHDFGKNDSAGGTDRFKPAWKVPVLNVFKQNWVNPYYGGGDKDPGCWFDFSVGDIDFFMTDGRYYRDFKKGTMLGEVQKKWLIEKLKASTAKFKVIGSGTL